MLFYTALNIKGTMKPFVVMGRINQDSQVAHITFKNILMDKSAYKLLRYAGDIVHFDGVAGYENLLPVCDTKTPTNVNFTQVFSILLKAIKTGVSENLFKNLAIQLNAKSQNRYGLTERDIECFYNAVVELLNYQNGRLSVKYDVATDALINTEVTIPILENSKEEEYELEFIKEGKNVDRLMTNSDDDVFIRLDTYEEILVNDGEVNNFLGNVIVPFKRPEFYTPNYRNALTPDFNMKSLIGDADNNDLDIQPNEMEFYNAMKELINYGIRQEYPEKDLEECISNHISSARVKNYLKNLAVAVAGVNWGFTGYFPISQLANFDVSDLEDLENDSDDRGEDEGSGDMESAEGKKTFFAKEFSQDGMFDGEYIITDVIDKASCTDIYAPAEAVIKLLRWGDRKPTRLKLNALSEYLDLANCRIEKTSGSFKNLKVRKVGGATYSPRAIIKTPNKIKDVNYAMSIGGTSSTLAIPVGLLLTKQYEGGMIQEVAVSIPTLIKHLKECPYDVRGIQYIDNKIVTELDINSATSLALDNLTTLVRNSRSGERVYLNTEEFIDFYLNYGQYSMDTSDLTILDSFLNMKDIGSEIVQKSFSNPSELSRKYLTDNGLDPSTVEPDVLRRLLKDNAGVKPYLNATLAKQLVELVVNVSNQNINFRREGKTASLQDYFEMYMVAMIKVGMLSSSDILRSSDNSEISKLSAFDSSNQTVENKEDVEERKRKEMCEFLIRPIPENSELVVLKSKPLEEKHDKTGKVIQAARPSADLGYLFITVIDGVKRYIITDSLPNGCTVKKQRLFVDQIVRVAISDTYNLLHGNNKAVKVFYHSEEAWKNLGVIISKYVG